MGDLYAKGKKVVSSLNNALAIICKDKDGNKSNIQKELDNVQVEINTLYNNLGGLTFGKDGDGNVGYYGADDSLIPFKGYQVGSYYTPDYLYAGAEYDFTLSFEKPFNKIPTVMVVAYLGKGSRNETSYASCYLKSVTETNFTVHVFCHLHGGYTNYTLDWIAF